jgi:hypothetical protein
LHATPAQASQGMPKRRPHRRGRTSNRGSTAAGTARADPNLYPIHL